MHFFDQNWLTVVTLDQFAYLCVLVSCVELIVEEMFLWGVDRCLLVYIVDWLILIHELGGFYFDK